MRLIFRILSIEQKGKTRLARRESKWVPVEIILEARDKTYKEKAESADKILETLDKILKKSRIEITDIKSIKIDNQNKNRYTSYKIAEAIQRALKIILVLSK